MAADLRAPRCSGEDTKDAAEPGAWVSLGYSCPFIHSFNKYFLCFTTRLLLSLLL